MNAPEPFAGVISHTPVRHHILSVLVENKAGVLARIAGLFARRGFNIYSLAVAPAEGHARFSRVTIVVDAASRVALLDAVAVAGAAIVDVDANRVTAMLAGTPGLFSTSTERMWWRTGVCGASPRNGSGLIAPARSGSGAP